MDVQARPLGSLPAGIKFNEEEKTMRINGNFFNFMNVNSSLFNSSSMISRLLGSRNVGSRNITNRTIANRNTAPNFMDGVVYSKGNRTASKLYTREGMLAGARYRRHPNQRKAFYSGQEILDAIEKYDGYMLGYDGAF